MTTRAVRILTLTSCYPLYEGHFNASYVQALCEHLAQLGAEVTVLAPHAPGAPREEVMHGVRVIRFRYLPSRWETLCYGGAAIPERVKRYWRYRLMLVPFFLAYGVSAWRVARRTRCDVIAAHWIVSIVVGWWLKVTLRKPLVAVSYGVEAFTAMQRPWLRRVTRWAFQRSDRVYTISEAARAGLQCLGVPAHKIQLYAVGPDPAVVAHQQEDAPGMRVEDGEAPVVLFVGRLVNRKGITYLLDAFRQVQRHHPASRLVIVGEGPEGHRLKVHAEGLRLNGAVRFVEAPSAEALAPWYRRCTVFVLPSIVDATGDTEGLGLVLLEALAFGKPIIGTRVGGIPEVIEDGKTGLLVEPGDADGLARAIVSVLSDQALAQRLVSNGQALLKNRYNWAVGAKQLYDDVLTLVREPAIAHAQQ